MKSTNSKINNEISELVKKICDLIYAANYPNPVYIKKEILADYIKEFVSNIK